LAKNLKLNIKNTQIAKALNLDSVKEKLAQKKSTEEVVEKEQVPKKKKEPVVAKKAKPKVADVVDKKAKQKVTEVVEEVNVAEQPRAKARSKSVFAETEKMEVKEEQIEDTAHEENFPTEIEEQSQHTEAAPTEEPPLEPSEEIIQIIETETTSSVKFEEQIIQPSKNEEVVKATPIVEEIVKPVEFKNPPVRLGPTGRHVNDLFKPKPVQKPLPKSGDPAPVNSEDSSLKNADRPKVKQKLKSKSGEFETTETTADTGAKKGDKTSKFKEFRDIKPTTRPVQPERGFGTRDRQGLGETEEQFRWRKKRRKKLTKAEIEEATIRPSELSIRLPISIKDLAIEMKLKASQLIEKLFLQGAILTLNDVLDDETTIQLLGNEFGCDIKIDTTEERRIQITDKTIRQEISESAPEKLMHRAPVVAFMGHVDHGKTSLIDAIRSSNRTASEAGAITQHIGAFRCSTAVGDITILDTPGHEAFSAMRARGADVTDIVVLVIAGDEGAMKQTEEAIQHAKAAGVSIVVAINKCDKPAFDAEKVYRQLADHDLLPEVWGGQTITINCSAITKEGIPQLLEMLALQAEVLELNADRTARARGTVIESEMHKGLGAIASLLVQNGTLKKGDALVFDQYWGYVKTMHDEHGTAITEAGPSTPVEITGLSGLPAAGQEFIVVENDKEARNIAEARSQKLQGAVIQRRPVTLENYLEDSVVPVKKVLNVIVRADVQGSLEALKNALIGIESDKAEVNIIFSSVGEISESDVLLAAASKAIILGFHTKVESHAESLIKQYSVQIKLHDIIYHAIDAIKDLLTGTLDKLEQEVAKGKAEVKATFKSSQHGIIAGCVVTEGVISRSNHIRIFREGAEIWKGPISSIKRVKEDVKEVRNGFECGILVTTNNIREGDTIEAFEIIYIQQKL